ncbi:MAG: hypothetical protein AB7K24_24355 [Gemmataceae bacterium]
MFNTIFKYTGITLLLLYSVTGLFGWEFFEPSRESHEAAEQRHKTGATPRSFWFFGSRGGK